MTDTSSSKADRTNNAILDAAYALFTSQGYAATSMREIAERARLAPGSIYNHFSSKEHIFETIVLNRHPIYAILPLLEAAQGATVDEYIRNAAHSLVAELGQHPEFINLLLIELVEFKGRHAPLLFEKIKPEIILLSQRLVVFQTDLRPIPLPLLMRVFVGLFFSYFITEMMLKSLMPPEMDQKALDAFVDIFLGGIKPSSSEMADPS
jgi:AcrR family transcriptional regulator